MRSLPVSGKYRGIEYGDIIYRHPSNLSSPALSPPSGPLALSTPLPSIFHIEVGLLKYS